MVFDIRNHFESLTQQLLARDLITPSLFSHGTFLGDQSDGTVSVPEWRPVTSKRCDCF